MMLKYITFAASICFFGIFPMDRLCTASLNNDIKSIVQLVSNLDVNEVVEPDSQTRLIHKVMQSIITLKTATVIALIKSGIDINALAKKRSDGDYQTPLEMAIDTCAMTKNAEGLKTKAYLLTYLYLHGALPNRRLLKLEQLRSHPHGLDIRLIALLGSLEQFKEACVLRGINHINAQQKLDEPAPEGYVPYHSLLYLAALLARPETIKYLIETMRLDVNVLSPHNGLPPLYAAQVRGDKSHEVTKLLLSYGACTGEYKEVRLWAKDVKSKAYENYTPIKFVVRKSPNEIMSGCFDCPSNTMVLNIE